MSGSDRRHPLVELDRAVLVEMLRPVAQPDAIARIELVMRGLSSTNYRVEVRHGAPLHLRITPRGEAACETEVAILQRVAPTTPVPAVQHAAPGHAHPHYIAEWVDGTPLDELLLAGAVEDPASLGEAVGRTLAAIHGHRFEREGRFDADLQVTPFEHGQGGEAEVAASERPGAPPAAGSGYARMLHGMIFGAAHRRLGPGRARRLWQKVLREDAACDWSDRYCCLVHFDYNPKNLLVRRASDGWEVAAVLDWEFAAAAGPLCDVGNLLRHRADYPAELVRSFTEAYAAEAPWLPRDWARRARLLDVSSQLESLSSVHDRPRVHAGALALLDGFLGR